MPTEGGAAASSEKNEKNADGVKATCTDTWIKRWRI